MTIEQRVIASPRRSIGGVREGRGKVAPEPEPNAKMAKKKLKRPTKKVLIIALVALLVAAGGVYFFVLKPAGPAAPPPPPVAGKVLTVPAVSVNLVDGHYLRLGLGLQLTADVAEAPDPAKALDLAIALFSGHTVAEVTDPTTREQLKVQLAADLTKAYEGEVMDVYLTDFVTQ